jgi:hypothetical protein
VFVAEMAREKMFSGYEIHLSFTPTEIQGITTYKDISFLIQPVRY